MQTTRARPTREYGIIPRVFHLENWDTIQCIVAHLMVCSLVMQVVKNEWNGLVRGLLDGKADMVVTSLKITPDRSTAVACVCLCLCL